MRQSLVDALDTIWCIHSMAWSDWKQLATYKRMSMHALSKDHTNAISFSPLFSMFFYVQTSKANAFTNIEVSHCRNEINRWISKGYKGSVCSSMGQKSIKSLSYCFSEQLVIVSSPNI